MLKYIVKRMFQFIPTFLVITAFVFFLSNAAPGDPIDAMMVAYEEAEPEVYERVEAQLREQYGMDKPVVIRYFIWLKNVFQGDLGVSMRYNEPVWDLVSERIVPTLVLTGTSLLVTLLIAIPLGVIAAIKPYSLWDTISSFFVFVGASSPNFFVALVLIYFFAVELKLLPAMGMYNPGGGGLAIHLILPVAVTAIRMMGTYVKQTRGSMLDVMNEEYVKTARAKGLSERTVIIKHMLRNAMIPIVSCIGLNVPFLVGGSTVVEKIFGWPGMGTLLILAVNQRDYNIIMGVTVLIAIAVLVVNLLIDLIYAYLDPKIRFE